MTLPKTNAPMIVQVIREQPVPNREPPVHAEIDGADVHGGVEIIEVQMDDIEVEVIQVDQVLMNDGNFEVIGVQMNDENVEIIEVQMDDFEEVSDQVEVVAPDREAELEIDVLLQGVDEEVSKFLFIFVLMKNKIYYNSVISIAV